MEELTPFQSLGLVSGMRCPTDCLRDPILSLDTFKRCLRQLLSALYHNLDATAHSKRVVPLPALYCFCNAYCIVMRRKVNLFYSSVLLYLSFRLFGGVYKVE